MKRYFYNLIIALMGMNPYKRELDGKERELDEKDRQLVQAAENIGCLNDRYYHAIENWDAEKRRANDCQRLVENLRQRLSEKDALIRQMQEELGRLESPAGHPQGGSGKNKNK